MADLNDEKLNAFLDDYKELIRIHGMEMRYSPFGHAMYVHDLREDVLLGQAPSANANPKLEKHLQEFTNSILKGK